MRKVLLITLLAALFAAPCWAADTDVNISTEKGEETEASHAVASSALAEQLVVSGREQKSPLQLAAAAQILANAGVFSDLEQGMESEDGRTDATKESDVSVQITPESLYAEAVAMAREQGNAEMAELLDTQSRVGQTRTSVNGAFRRYDRVYGRIPYTISFIGGRRAHVAVFGDGDDIELYVYDENNNLIISDMAGVRTNRRVTWTPRWTGPFRIEVVNPSSRVPYVDYQIRTS